MSGVTSYSRIQVTVEVNGSCYGADWTLEALVKQSGEEAVMMLETKLRDKGVKIIGKPKVLTITHIKDEV